MNGRGIAAALALGADGVWMGSRFIVTPEANAPMELKEALLEATSDETVHTRLYTGRTLRALANPWFAVKTMNFAFKMMDFALKMMNFAGTLSGRVKGSPKCGPCWR